MWLYRNGSTNHIVLFVDMERIVKGNMVEYLVANGSAI